MPDGRRSSFPGFLRSIGPEVVSSASDNDPTNVGTAVAVGARTGYRLSWVALLVALLLGVVMTIAAQLGTVAREDLQSLTLKRCGRRVAALLLVSVVTVNLVTRTHATAGLTIWLFERSLSRVWDAQQIDLPPDFSDWVPGDYDDFPTPALPSLPDAGR